MAYHDEVPEHMASSNNEVVTLPSTRRTVLNRALSLVASIPLLSV
jgi:hypothetical protein